MNRQKDEKNGKVVKVLTESRLVINLGKRDNIAVGDKFLVYEIGEEIFDPDDGSSLGCLEIVKGIGRVSHTQNAMSILDTNMTKQVASMYGLASITGTPQYETKSRPFDDPKVGDHVRYRVE